MGIDRTTGFSRCATLRLLGSTMLVAVAPPVTAPADDASRRLRSLLDDSQAVDVHPDSLLVLRRDRAAGARAFVHPLSDGHRATRLSEKRMELTALFTNCVIANLLVRSMPTNR